MLFRFSKFRDKSATSNRRCKVIYSYTQVNDDELTLAVGDVIEFLGEVRTRRVTGGMRGCLLPPFNLLGQ